MVLAGRASIPSPPSAVQKSDSPVTADTRFAAPEVSPARKIAIQKPETFVPHVSAISSPVPVLSQTVTLSKSTSSSNNESAGPASSSVPSIVTPVSSAQPLQQAISAAAAAAVTPRGTYNYYLLQWPLLVLHFNSGYWDHAWEKCYIDSYSCFSCPSSS
jgi:jasmonate ZIM domain-containing protein